MENPENLLTDLDKIPTDKKLAVFDLDGTLAESKSDLDPEMAGLLTKLLKKMKVAVIGGGKYEQFQRQFVDKFNAPEELMANLFLFPTTSTSFYRHDEGEWKRVYCHELPPELKKKIFEAFENTFRQFGYKDPDTLYGEVIEDRGTQVTFSAAGQRAPLEAKERWNKKNFDLRLHMVAYMQGLLSEVEVRAGGLTSIDVTQKGIDKEYGLMKIKEHLGIEINDMIFVGDAIFPGGNDYAALRTGVISVKVGSVRDTKKVVRKLLG